MNALEVKDFMRKQLHSHQDCPKSSVGYLCFKDNDTTKELLTPLLRQLNFWRECSINEIPKQIQLLDTIFKLNQINTKKSGVHEKSL